MASPILAAILSFFIPGLGQFYAGHFLRGVGVFVISLILGAVGAVGIFGLIIGSIIILILTLILPLVAFIFWIWNIYDAYQLAAKPIQMA